MGFLKKNKFSKSYCLICGTEMRKWLTDEENCFSMCINENCFNHGAVSRDIQNINNFKFGFEIKI
jgi:hypothetical protein